MSADLFGVRAVAQPPQKPCDELCVPGRASSRSWFADSTASVPSQGRKAGQRGELALLGEMTDPEGEAQCLQLAWARTQASGSQGLGCSLSSTSLSSGGHTYLLP